MIRRLRSSSFDAEQNAKLLAVGERDLRASSGARRLFLERLLIQAVVVHLS